MIGQVVKRRHHRNEKDTHAKRPIQAGTESPSEPPTSTVEGTWPQCQKDAVIYAYEQTVARCAADLLTNRGYYELTKISCEYQYRGGIMMLSGNVSSFYMKQVAQESVRMIEQVYQVVNRLEVSYSDGSQH